MITNTLMKIMASTFRLWLTIIETSQVRLSTNFYYISSKLNQLLEHYNPKLSNYNKNQERQENQNPQSNETDSQLFNIRKKNIIKVCIINNRAFWIQNNKFWTSKIVDGYIDNRDAEEIDAHSLSNKEVSMMLDILDELNSEY